jgi:hypothetical protein
VSAPTQQVGHTQGRHIASLFNKCHFAAAPAASLLTEAGTAAAGRSTEGRATRRGSIPTMPGNAGLRTVSIPSGSPSGGGQRAGSMSQANGSGSLDSAPRSGRRSGSRDASHDGSVAAVPAASLSEEQLQALALEYKNLALEIKDFEALDLQVGCRHPSQW